MPLCLCERGGQGESKFTDKLGSRLILCADGTMKDLTVAAESILHLVVTYVQ